MDEKFIDKLFNIFSNTRNVKDKYRKITSLIILVLLLFFAYIYFDYIIDENARVTIVVLFVLYILIKEAITDHDVLYSGNPEKNKFVKAFQYNLPSKYLMEKFKLPKEEAIKLWYLEFNKWKDSKNPMHDTWLQTLSRGFKCRMVYFTIISFRFITLLSIVFILAIFGVDKFHIYYKVPVLDDYMYRHSNLTTPIIFTLVCLLIYLTFLLINYPSVEKLRGCFLRFSEINDQNINWLKANFTYENGKKETE
jgi:hypothetical protein